MGDVDPCAAGLYLVPALQRIILLHGDHPDFAEKMLVICKLRQIDVLISTVDSELSSLAFISDKFLALGIQVPLSPYSVLMMCRDKYKLLTYCNTFLTK